MRSADGGDAAARDLAPLWPTGSQPARRPVERLLGSRGRPLGLGDVRIHTDAAAAESVQSMRARAYTYGPDIVFNRGEFDPFSDAGRALLEHELEHAARQSSPSRYRLEFQKLSSAPQKFFKQVEDALRDLKPSNRNLEDRSYLRDLLALSKAVEAQNQAEVRQLTVKVVGASPSSDAPSFHYVEFVNELIARTFLMGLDAEANRLRAFFRAPGVVHRSRIHPKFGADKGLWQEITNRTIAQAKFSGATEAATSIDNLLNTFRILVAEASRIDFNQVRSERKAHDPSSGYVDSDTHSSYLGSLMGRLRELTVPIFHGVETLMAAAIADLEADKGATALNTVKTVIQTKIRPAYSTTLGDEHLMDLAVAATRSTFGPREGKHHDYFDTGKVGAKRSVTINYFDKNQPAGLYDKPNPVGHLILTRQRQIAFLEQLYVTANRAAMGATPLKLESVDDWRSFLHQKFTELRNAGESKDQALLAVIRFLSGYLETFTTSTPFNIEDVIKQDSENYNKRQFPRDISGQLIQDCGVYALRTVYMLSLVKDALKLRIRFIFLPVHVGLIITGDDLTTTLIAHNNKIHPFDALTLGEERKRWAAKDPTKPTTDEQFIGEVAGGLFSPNVDVPFRLEDAPAIPKNDPKEKEKLQQYYGGTLRTDVLADVPKAGITQFHLQYLRLNDEAKQMHNGVVVPTWNLVAHKAWMQHRDKLFAELGKARNGKPHNYSAVSQAYLADLDAAFKPVVDAADAMARSRRAVSTTLGANPDLTAPTATRGFGSRVSFSFPGEVELAAHRAAVADQTKLHDPGKPAAITPPFATPTGFLQRIY